MSAGQHGPFKVCVREVRARHLRTRKVRAPQCRAREHRAREQRARKHRTREHRAREHRAPQVAALQDRAGEIPPTQVDPGEVRARQVFPGKAFASCQSGLHLGARDRGCGRCSRSYARGRSRGCIHGGHCLRGVAIPLRSLRGLGGGQSRGAPCKGSLGRQFLVHQEQGLHVGELLRRDLRDTPPERHDHAVVGIHGQRVQMHHHLTHASGRHQEAASSPARQPRLQQRCARNEVPQDDLLVTPPVALDPLVLGRSVEVLPVKVLG